MKKTFLKLFSLVIILTFTLTSCASTLSSQQLHIYDDHLTKKEMIEEIDLVVNQLLMIHPKFNDNNHDIGINDEDFIDYVNQIKMQVPKHSTPEEFYYVISQIPAYLNDNHCYMTTPFIYPDEFINTHLKFNGNQLYVTDSFQGLEKGDEILLIGGLEVSEILEKTDKYISNASTHGLKHALNNELKFKGIYHFLDNVDDEKALVFTVQSKDHSKKNVRIRFDEFQNLRSYSKTLKEKNSKEYNPNIQYYEKFDDDNKIAYLRIKTNHVHAEDFKAFMKNFYRRSNEKKSAKIIIDLRNNGGGKHYTGDYIFSGYNITNYIDAFGNEKSNSIYNSTSQIHSDVYVLVNGGTSGSAYKLAYELQKNQLATIVGSYANESTYFFYNDGKLKNTDIVLPHTQFKLYVTDAYKKFDYDANSSSDSHEITTMIPDIFIETLEDEFIYQNDEIISLVIGQ